MNRNAGPPFRISFPRLPLPLRFLSVMRDRSRTALAAGVTVLLLPACASDSPQQLQPRPQPNEAKAAAEADSTSSPTVAESALPGGADALQPDRPSNSGAVQDPQPRRLPSLLRRAVRVALRNVGLTPEGRSALDTHDYFAVVDVVNDHYDVLNLFFGFDTIEVGSQDPERQSVTKAHLGRLRARLPQACGSSPLLIFGSADSTGAPLYNLSLSEKRALHVRDQLAEHAGDCVFEVYALGPIDPSDRWLWPDWPDFEPDPAKYRRVDVWIRLANPPDRYTLREVE